VPVDAFVSGLADALVEQLVVEKYARNDRAGHWL
jgi:hypothetical protein